ncbi:MAG: heterodisulfide reductase [candidate division Zixibacteria bacterium]|nr:heterodisulfide reductase [candidate division Zixibacteria bacterium]
MAVRLIEPDLKFIREVKRLGGDTLKKCYQCATCSVVCNLSPDDKPFPRKEMIMAQWGQIDNLVKDPDIWLCYQCNDCTTHCPREAKPGDVLAAIRSYIYRYFSFPKFMGTALSSPKALPYLVLVPVLILLGCILAFAPDANNDGVRDFLQNPIADFDLFLPHSSVDGLFVLGNIIIFLFAAIGFMRFWKGLKSSGGGNGPSLATALIGTIKDIITHKAFFSCDANKPRSWGHIITIAGFVGAMVTTGAVFVFVFIPHYLHLLGLESLNSFFHVPINLPHPVKFIGMFSGLGLIIGGAMLIFRRMQNKDNVGATGYADYFFLYVIFFTGLTGMLSWLTRVFTPPMVAYVNYFIHMVFVFMLLWYMPYSKFAHMFYRTLALVYARSIGREAKKAA